MPFLSDGSADDEAEIERKPTTQDAEAIADPTMALSEGTEQPSETIETPPVPYTTFTRNDKRLLTILLGPITMTSPLTATIYFPLLPLLRSHFHTSTQAINLTLTIYIIFQALSPAIFGPLSDTLGRRPVYMITQLIYLLANLGLALNKNSLAALLVVRALQSLGASASQSVSYGVVADVCVPSERGSMLGLLSMALNLGTCIGPIVGGVVAYKSDGYKWIFWALVVFGAVLMVLVVLLLPETCRNVVGNGDGRARGSFMEESLWNICRGWFQRRRLPRHPEVETSLEDNARSYTTYLQRFRIKNPFACLTILFHRDTFLSLWLHASFYLVDYDLVAVLPQIYTTSTYHFNELQLGLIYLPRGFGIISGSFLLTKLMDYNYRHVARKAGWHINKVSGDDLYHFPIERARSRGSSIVLLISTATLVGYGWAVHFHAHYAVLIVLQYVMGFWGTYFYTVFMTLLIDTHPDIPSTASATASILRCVLAAGGVAALQPILDRVGRGWFFTILGLWSGGFGIAAVWLLRTRCMAWRQKESVGRRSKEKSDRE